MGTVGPEGTGQQGVSRATGPTFCVSRAVRTFPGRNILSAFFLFFISEELALLVLFVLDFTIWTSRILILNALGGVMN